MADSRHLGQIENYLQFSSVLGGGATFCEIAYTYGSAAVLPKHVSHNSIVPVSRFILYSLYCVTIYFWQVCFVALWSTSHPMKVVVLYKFCEDQAFYDSFDAFSLVLTSQRFGNACLCRFWFPDMIP